MSDRITTYGDFSLTNEIVKLHEWVADELIDGFAGHTCTLVYPPKKTECPNCKISPDTGRSSGIYKSGGPISFTNHTVCPYCGGEGKKTLPQTGSIRLRIYWEPRDWQRFGINIGNAQGDAMIIGYMNDYPKIQRSKEIILDDKIAGIKNYRCRSKGEAQPWGIRHTRYFVQMVERQGS